MIDHISNEPGSSVSLFPRQRPHPQMRLRFRAGRHKPTIVAHRPVKGKSPSRDLCEAGKTTISTLLAGILLRIWAIASAHRTTVQYLGFFTDGMAGDDIVLAGLEQTEGKMEFSDDCDDRLVRGELAPGRYEGQTECQRRR
jgi:hypothetical protein